MRAATAREFLIFKTDGEDLSALATQTGQCFEFSNNVLLVSPVSQPPIMFFFLSNVNLNLTPASQAIPEPVKQCFTLGEAISHRVVCERDVARSRTGLAQNF